MKKYLTVAAAQFPVSGKIERNSKYIHSLIEKAAADGVQVIHFPESSLPGYGPKHFTSFNGYCWDTLESHIQSICTLAASLNIWVILGSMQRDDCKLPKNCTLVVSSDGSIAGVYNKQRLYNSETSFYSSGIRPLVIDINGYKCGFLICYDNCFPELYDEYRDLEIELLFHSFLNAENSKSTNIKNLIVSNLYIRAADNQIWISASNSSKRYSPLAASIVRPDGSMVKCKSHQTGFVIDSFPEAALGWTYDNRKI